MCRELQTLDTRAAMKHSKMLLLCRYSIHVYMYTFISHVKYLLSLFIYFCLFNLCFLVGMERVQVPEEAVVASQFSHQIL